MEGHQNVKGDKHPSQRAYRQEYRPIPERMRLAVRNWRARIRDTLRELGKPATLEIWRGPSRFDGRPIVVLAARVRASSSVNPKTNDMVQIYIVPQADPAQSLQDERDRSVCGTCVHRPYAATDDHDDDDPARRDCFVNVSWAPRNLWMAWRDGRVPLAPPGIFEGAAVRFGAWGDPAAVPLEVWQPIVDGAVTHTGYTQRWPELDAAEWGWLMASVITPAQLRDAQIAGWRTFRTLYGAAQPMLGEAECLATAKHVSCLGCGGCGGNNQPERTSYYLRAHGFRLRDRGPKSPPIAEAK
jgi:hypothetical protein